MADSKTINQILTRQIFNETVRGRGTTEADWNETADIKRERKLGGIGLITLMLSKPA